MASLKWFACGALAGLILPLACAQAAIPFQDDFGGAGNEFGRACHPIVNGPLAGDIIAVGEAPQPGNPAKTDAYVVITNGNGIPIGPQWTLDMANGNDFAKDFTETPSGNIVITGSFTSGVGTTLDIFVLEFNPATGVVVWSNDYAGSTPTGNIDDEAFDIEDVGNGFVIAGRSNSLHGTHTDAILFKISTTGAWIWGTAFDGGNANNDAFFSSTLLPNGNIMAGGFTFATGTADIFLVEVNGFGNKVFATRYGGASNEGVRRVKACSQAGPNANRVILSGNTGGSTSLIALVDWTTMAWVNGNTYKTALAGWTEGMNVVETPSPEFKFVTDGLTFDPLGTGNSNFEFYFSRFSSNLNINDWYRIHGGNFDDEGWGLDLAPPCLGDLNYAIIGTGVRTTNALGQQLDISQTNQTGALPCETVIPMPLTPITFNPVQMTNCQTLWGLLASSLPTLVVAQNTTPQNCPAANFGTRPAYPQHLMDNFLHGGQDAITGADTAFLSRLRLDAAANNTSIHSPVQVTTARPDPAKNDTPANGDALPAEQTTTGKSGLNQHR